MAVTFGACPAFKEQIQSPSNPGLTLSTRFRESRTFAATPQEQAMNRKITTLATLFAAGAFTATAMAPKLAASVKSTSDKSMVETGCGADKKDAKDASCGKDKKDGKCGKDMKDHKCGKDMKDGKCGKEHKCGKDGKCGKDKKAKDKKEKSCGAGSCGAKKN
jgi:hypothetical protein